MPPMKNGGVFERVAPVVDFPAAEARVRAFWRERDVFAKSLALRSEGPRFVFYEGPPTANGLPHNGHALTRVMKDVVPRYKAMRGFDVPRKGGWDTHGLPGGSGGGEGRRAHGRPGRGDRVREGAAHLGQGCDRVLRRGAVRAPLPRQRVPLHRG